MAETPKYNALHTLTGHEQGKPFTEAELMENRRSNNPQVRVLSRLALGLRGQVAKRKAAK